MGLFTSNKPGSGQNPLPEVSSGGIFRGKDVEYAVPDHPVRPPIPQRNPPELETPMKNPYSFSVAVPDGFVNLYVDEIGDIIKKYATNWNLTYYSDGSIRAHLIAEQVMYDAIKRRIEFMLGLTVEENE